jgi:hypothetical protein
MKAFATLLLISCVVSSAAYSGEKDKKNTSLPERLLTAKTVYIDNQSDETDINDKAYDEVKKWGRFQLVSDKSQADLIFLFTTGEYTSYAADNSSNTTEVKANYTYLTVIDANSAQHLWSTSRKWGSLYGGYHSATRGVIRELKKRIDEQASRSFNSGIVRTDLVSSAPTPK